MKSIYLASPYGFSRQQREMLLPVFVKKLEALGLRVHEPFAHTKQIVYGREPGWAHGWGGATCKRFATPTASSR